MSQHTSPSSLLSSSALEVKGLVCPLTKAPLYQDGDELVTADGQYRYSASGKIIKLLPPRKESFTVIIPARLSSTRLPAKPLIKIVDLELINTVLDSAILIGGKVVVACDDLKIKEAVEAHIALRGYQQAQAILTDVNHINGTERLAEAIEILGLDEEELVVNIQGDEPFFNPQVIKDLVTFFRKAEQEDPNLRMATIGQDCLAEDVTNPNAVKVVKSLHGKALYFSRSPIPYPREKTPEPLYYKHAGVYCYRAGFVKLYKTLAMTPLAQTESLEQLKILEHGFSIALLLIKGKGFIGVDTAEDVTRAIALKEAYLTQAGLEGGQFDAKALAEYLQTFGEANQD